MSRRTSLARGGAERTASTTSARTALATVCQRGLTSTVLGQELRARLLRLLAFDAYCLNTCDTESGVVTSSVGDGLSPEQARALFAIEADGTDLNLLSDLHRGPTRVASLWQTSGGHPEHSQRMREIFLPLGFGDELRAALVADDICYGYLHLFRHRGQRSFSARDLLEVAALGPIVARALRFAASPTARGATSRSNDSALSRPALIVLDAADRAVRQSAGAEALLGVCDTLRGESGIAHVLRDVASRSRRGDDARATFVTAQREPVTVAALQVGDETMVVVTEPSTRELEVLTLAAFALTSREREVSRLVAAGLSNQRIAEELGIGLHTAKDHVKSVLTKTGCATRTELAARLRGG